MDYHKTPQQLYSEDLNGQYALGKLTKGDADFRATYHNGCPDCGAETTSFDLESDLVKQWDGHKVVEQRQVKISAPCCGSKAVVCKTVSDLKEATSHTRRNWDELEGDFIIRHPENTPDFNLLKAVFADMTHEQREAFIGRVSVSTLRSMGFKRSFIKEAKTPSQKPTRFLSKRKLRKLQKEEAKLARVRRLGFERPNY